MVIEAGSVDVVEEVREGFSAVGLRTMALSSNWASSPDPRFGALVSSDETRELIYSHVLQPSPEAHEDAAIIIRVLGVMGHREQRRASG